MIQFHRQKIEIYLRLSAAATSLIAFYGISTTIRLLYVERLGNCIYCAFYFLLCRFFANSYIKYFYLIQIICRVVWFQLSLSNSNDYMVSSHYFYLRIVINPLF